MDGPESTRSNLDVRIREWSEPFTEAREPAILALSDAYWHLRGELEEYVRRRVRGRSFLISGHRGSGKTTLVLKAIEDVRDEFTSLANRPLLIQLQGPDLLPDADSVTAPPTAGDDDEPEVPGDGDGKGGEEGSGGAEDPEGGTAGEDLKTVADNGLAGAEITARALKRITIAIYRALAEEMSRAYWKRVNRQAGPDPAQGPRIDPEVAAHLKLKLDDAPDPIELREFWRLAGALETGVLPRFDPPPDQGLRELVALASAAQAYQIVHGEKTASSTDTTSAQDDLSKTTTTNITLGDVTSPLFAVLTGGAVGAGAFFGSLRGLGAALLGVVAAVLSGIVINRTRLRSRKRTVSQTYTFIRANNTSTLERELPKLVDRLQDAGLAPVFVVDELDKIRHLPRAMDGLVTRLKHFVTESAFFCFLTDRDYFESLRTKALQDPYPREHTYFSDRLFVTFKPEQLHTYLNVLFDQTFAGDDAADFRVFLYVLLHQSRMHPVDLRRAVNKYLSANGAIEVPPGHVTSRLEYVLPVAVQVAVELSLTEDAVRTRLQQDPNFTQPVYDALYYPSRRWASGEGILDTSPRAFREYLTERMKPNEEPADDTEPKPDSAGASPQLPVSELDFLFLHERMTGLVELLVGPDSLVGALRSTTAYQPAVDVYKALETFQPLLERISTEEHAYRFRFDGFGRVLAPEVADAIRRHAPASTAGLGTPRAPGPQPTAPPPPGGDVEVAPPPEGAPTPPTTEPDGAGAEQHEPRAGAPTPSPYDEADAIYLHQLNELIIELTGEMDLTRMDSEIHVLSGPPWQEVQKALRRLERRALRGELTREGVPESEEETDLRTVENFRSMLERRGGLLLRTLIHGARLARAGSRADHRERLSHALRVLSRVLNLEAHPTAAELDQVLAYLEDDVRDIPDLAEWALMEDEWSGLRLTRERFQDWEQCARRNVRADPPWTPADQDMAERAAWDRWHDAMHRLVLEGEGSVPISVHHLLCAVARAAPGTLFDFDVDQMSIFDWSLVIEYAWNSYDTPEWVAVIAMAKLGLGRMLQRHPLSSDDGREMHSWIESRRADWLRDRPIAYLFAETPGGLLDELPSKVFGTFAGLSSPRGEPTDLFSIEALADCVLVELPDQGHGPDPDAYLDSVRSAWSRYAARDSLLCVTEQGQRGPKRHPQIIAPETLDIAIKRALELGAGREPSPP